MTSRKIHEAAAPAEPPGRIPSLAVYAETPPAMTTHAVEDNAFAPLMFAGDVAIIDPCRRDPENGRIYLIQQDGAAVLRVIVSSVMVSVSGEDDVWLATLGEPFAWRGPILRDCVRAIGRVVGLLDTTRAGDPRDETMTAFRESEHWKARFNDICRRYKRLEEHHAGARGELAGAAALNARAAAFHARAVTVEEEMVATPATTPEGAICKLKVIWWYEYGCMSGTKETMNKKLLRDALHAFGEPAEDYSPPA